VVGAHPFRDLAEWPEGVRWTGTRRGLRRIDSRAPRSAGLDARWRLVGLGENGRSAPISSLHLDRGHRLWVTTDDRLHVIDASLADPVPQRVALDLPVPFGSVGRIAEDSEGSLWIGTDSCLV
jgi:ligand-binding sensor domain-containing protein